MGRSLRVSESERFSESVFLPHLTRVFVAFVSTTTRDVVATQQLVVDSTTQPIQRKSWLFASSLPFLSKRKRLKHC